MQGAHKFYYWALGISLLGAIGWIQVTQMREQMALNPDAKPSSTEQRLAPEVLASNAPPTAPPLQPDPQLQAIVDQQVKQLQNAGFDPTIQGIWVESGQGTVAQYQGQKPLAVASLTKLATSLTALYSWTVDHRFYTRVAAQGTIHEGVLTGDIILQGGGDPLYVWESAIVLGNSLNQLGIQRVTGRLILDRSSVFSMNFERDPQITGALLLQALDRDQWGYDILSQYEANLPPNTPKPQVIIEGGLAVQDVSDAHWAQAQLLVTQPSQPLVAILKQMNNYSNNEIAQLLADLLGGPQELARIAHTQAGVLPQEVSFSNGSGLGPENQISPRGVCAIIQAIGDRLAPHNLGVKDVLPISQQDPGTLSHRIFPTGLTAKTGTLWDVSTLGGLISGADQPAKQLTDPQTLCFAILNRGPDITFFYGSQETFVAQLKAQVTAAPPVVSQDVEPIDREQVN